MPPWTPYHMAAAFALSKRAWIQKQLAARQLHPIGNQDRIGKSHRVRVIREQRSNTTTRVSDTEIVVRVPTQLSITDDDVQHSLRLAAVRALKKEAKYLLPGRLAEHSAQTGLTYKSVAIKQLRSRWGSCNTHGDIALNCYLMQLPWDLIDYVLLHELTHTKIMAHGPRFWSELANHVTNLDVKRRAMRAQQPTLLPIKTV